MPAQAVGVEAAAPDVTTGRVVLVQFVEPSEILRQADWTAGVHEASLFQHDATHRSIPAIPGGPLDQFKSVLLFLQAVLLGAALPAVAGASSVVESTPAVIDPQP